MWQELVENFAAAACCDEKRSAGRLNETLRRFKQRVAWIAQDLELLTVNRNGKVTLLGGLYAVYMGIISVCGLPEDVTI
jgi:hypothetical protein